MGARATESATSLPERSEGLRLAETIILTSQANAKSPAVLWLNLDRFRQINDSFGHTGGDTVIAEVIHRIRQHLAPDDLLACMGGDEFLCVLPDCASTAAEQKAYSVLHSIRKPMHLDNLQFRPSVSVGLATWAPGIVATRLIDMADRAMFDAKRQGGGRLVRAGAAPLPHHPRARLARDELLTESDIHSALEHGGLRLHYQPIIGFDGRITAFEALMRCHVNGRDVPPAVFIPVAEKTGQVVLLGEWCLTEGARFAARLRREWRETCIAINVSRAQITSPHFLSALHAALICSDVAPTCIDLEITESLFMEMSTTVLANLQSIREMGLGLSIDDFGTGFSCLSNLKDLPATKLKLDRAFIEVLPADKKALAVVRAMSQLAHDLDLSVVAEGVETQAQLDCLRKTPVDAVQGFLYARPMTDEALLQWLPRCGFH